MSRYNPHYNSAPVYDAAGTWKEQCLLEDGSALAPNETLWTLARLDELDEHFVRNLDDGEGGFFDKLEGQLGPVSPEARRLMAEVIWAVMLFPSNAGPQRKRDNIRRIWSLGGTEPPVDHVLLSDATLKGLGSAGTAYMTQTWREASFLITLVRSLKKLDPDQIRKILSDGWRFLGWTLDLPGADRRQLTHILSHILFPDLFERISSAGDKVQILEALTDVPRGTWRKRPLADYDRALLDLRTRIEAEAGKSIDFYQDDLKPKWRGNDAPASFPPPAEPKQYLASSGLASATLGGAPGATTALNTILFGPPGTGKTFATMREAVAICDGRERADALDADALRARHDALRDAGRIAFVTFHQSFSYEDFVEGLRPETETQDGAGFRLVPRPGVLREMADLAARGRATSTEGGIDLNQIRIFKMSLGRAHDEDDAYIFEDCIENGHVLLGWGGLVDWSPSRFDSFEGILNGWQKIEPDANSNNFNVKAIWSLRNDMREGDVVVVSNGNSAFRAVGVIAGNYEFVHRAEVDHYHHRRRVQWTWIDPVGLPASTIMDVKFSQQTIYRIAKAKLKPDALAGYLSEKAQPEHLPHVLIIDEINRANVSKVFGELITLLEDDKRAGAANAISVRLPYSGEAFSLPANLHILGTMNTADRSIALLDTALRRRFDFREMPPQPDLLSPVQKGLVGGLDLEMLLTKLNERIEYLFDRDHLIGHAFLINTKTRTQVDEVMRRKILPLLAEYFHEDWEKIVAVLGGYGKQGFIERTALSVPPGLEDAGETRHRYSVCDIFPEDAYVGLQA